MLSAIEHFHVAHVPGQWCTKIKRKRLCRFPPRTKGIMKSRKRHILILTHAKCAGGAAWNGRPRY